MHIATQKHEFVLVGLLTPDLDSKRSGCLIVYIKLSNIVSGIYKVTDEIIN